MVPWDNLSPHLNHTSNSISTSSTVLQACNRNQQTDHACHDVCKNSAHLRDKNELVSARSKRHAYVYFCVHSISLALVFYASISVLHDADVQCSSCEFVPDTRLPLSLMRHNITSPVGLQEKDRSNFTYLPSLA